MSDTDAKLAAALRECEEACPCRRGTWCSRVITRGQRRYICFCSPAHKKPRSNAGHLPCKWPGHAAYRNYGDLREKAVLQAAVDWSISRWNAEVANRPDVNIHKRTLDDTWRQVERHFKEERDR